MWASGGRRGYLPETTANPKVLEGYDRVAAYRAMHGYNAQGVLIETSRLVLVASNVPDKEAALEGAKGMLYEYDFESATADSIIGLIEALVHENQGPFGSIAMACNNSTLLSLSRTLFLDQHTLQGESDVMRVMRALGGAVRSKGCVTFLACRLGTTDPGKQPPLPFDRGCPHGDCLHGASRWEVPGFECTMPLLPFTWMLKHRRLCVCVSRPPSGKALLSKLGAQTDSVFVASDGGGSISKKISGEELAYIASHPVPVADTLAGTHRGAFVHGHLAPRVASNMAGKATPTVESSNPSVRSH